MPDPFFHVRIDGRDTGTVRPISIRSIILRVKVLETDDRGRLKLSMKAAEGNEAAPAA